MNEVNEVFEFFRQGRGILITKKEGKMVSVLIKDNDKLRLFEMDEETLISSIVNATKKGRAPGIFNTPVGILWILEKEQMRRWIRSVEMFEVKTVD